jgi:hypothetical protein
MRPIIRAVGMFVTMAGVGVIFAATAPADTGAQSPLGVHGGALVQSKGTIEILASQETDNGGWVAFTGTGFVEVRGDRGAGVKKGSLRTSASVSAGGGVWQYFSYFNPDTKQKECHSDYHHNIVQHGSTAKMNGYSTRDIAEAAQWSNAMENGFTTATCYAYWHKS